MYTLRETHLEMDNHFSLIGKAATNRGFSIARLDYQKVIGTYSQHDCGESTVRTDILARLAETAGMPEL